ncbi:hypothetical protein RRG08_017736 [Elysia crispata]|uniref:Uncharacterized protein n=1 Tax=Elysia crispata TaxID=231223 RepID=A0AAE1CKW3_9GAST|nr:hypothetical protein RRG08_017736 [Elysia crispata]
MKRALLQRLFTGRFFKQDAEYLALSSCLPLPSQSITDRALALVQPDRTFPHKLISLQNSTWPFSYLARTKRIDRPWKLLGTLKKYCTAVSSDRLGEKRAVEIWLTRGEITSRGSNLGAWSSPSS